MSCSIKQREWHLVNYTDMYWQNSAKFRWHQGRMPQQKIQKTTVSRASRISPVSSALTKFSTLEISHYFPSYLHIPSSSKQGWEFGYIGLHHLNLRSVNWSHFSVFFFIMHLKSSPLSCTVQFLYSFSEILQLTVQIYWQYAYIIQNI